MRVGRRHRDDCGCDAEAILARAPLSTERPYYLEALAPLFSCSEVRAASASVRRALLVLQLHAYLEFTVQLELGPVHRVVSRLVEDDAFGWLPGHMREAARAILREEDQHAAMCRRMAEEVTRVTGVTQLSRPPAFLGRLEALEACAGPALAPWLAFFFVVVSETLVTSDLRTLRRAGDVQPAVRLLVDAHARDEAFHHAFFAALAEMLWARLAPSLRRKIGVQLPEILSAYLDPDMGALREMLERFPTMFSAPARILESLPPSYRRVQRAAAPSVAVFRRSGVFDDAEVVLAFSTRGWSFEQLHRQEIP